MSERQTSTATRTSPPGEPEPGVPLITWVISAAALLVVLTAGALFLDPSPNERAALLQPAQENEVQENGPDPVQVLAPKNPLEITASFLDAQERAKLWNPTALLSRIELVVDEGRPKGLVHFEFGEPVGQAIPGAPLTPKRYTLSYDGPKIEETAVVSPQMRISLPEPNCPLEVAFRKLNQGGVSTQGRVGVLYTHSQKHGKPIWLFTNAEGQATSLNADSCALLRR